ncbi:hypothetical protein DIPPA_27891 [Diplonema papillatum]|nr:hypothetical protein DIPPA_27891 [Diplonema papillatum]
MPLSNLGLASHEPIDEEEPASDATQTSGGEDAREPGSQTRSAAARVGFALDVANSGARFVTDVVPDQAPVSSFLGFTHRRLH